MSIFAAITKKIDPVNPIHYIVFLLITSFVIGFLLFFVSYMFNSNSFSQYIDEEKMQRIAESNRRYLLEQCIIRNPNQYVECKDAINKLYPN